MGGFVSSKNSPWGRIYRNESLRQSDWRHFHGRWHYTNSCCDCDFN